MPLGRKLFPGVGGSHGFHRRVQTHQVLALQLTPLSPHKTLGLELSDPPPLPALAWAGS